MNTQARVDAPALRPGMVVQGKTIDTVALGPHNTIQVRYTDGFDERFLNTESVTVTFKLLPD